MYHVTDQSSDFNKPGGPVNVKTNISLKGHIFSQEAIKQSEVTFSQT